MGGRPRILIVEDEAILAFTLEDILTAMDLEVAGMVTSAASAFEAARELRPDVILMDVTINGSIDGITAAEWIRRDLDCPILFTTAHSDQERLSRMNRIANARLIPKPFDAKVLRQALLETLARAR